MNEFENCGSYRRRISRISGVSLTRAYGTLWAALGTTSVLAAATSGAAGPLAGITEQPPSRKPEAITRFFVKLHQFFTIHPPIDSSPELWAYTAWRRTTREQLEDNKSNQKLLPNCNYYKTLVRPQFLEDLYGLICSGEVVKPLGTSSYDGENKLNSVARTYDVTVSTGSELDPDGSVGAAQARYLVVIGRRNFRPRKAGKRTRSRGWLFSITLRQYPSCFCCDQITRKRLAKLPLVPANHQMKKGPKSLSCAHGRANRNLIVFKMLKNESH